ncbi:hypothetical protein BDW62DRAFT_194104 [Aspergillus aurantiobrunneus]
MRGLIRWILAVLCSGFLYLSLSSGGDAGGALDTLQISLVLAWPMSCQSPGSPKSNKLSIVSSIAHRLRLSRYWPQMQGHWGG